MAQSTIINRIIDQAREDAAETIHAAQKSAQKIKENIKEEVTSQIDELNSDFEQKRSSLEHKSDLIFSLEARKQTLSKKRELIDEAFHLAEDKLDNLPEKEWSVLIAAIVAASSQTGKEKLIVPQKDLKKYQEGFLSSINRGLKSNGLSGELTLSQKPADFKSGIMLEGDEMDINGDFKVLLNQVREKHEKEIADILFGKQEEDG
jgi:V/A-type H+-transporting ATPase subunit E